MFLSSELFNRIGSKVLVCLQDAERRGVYLIEKSSALPNLVEILEYDASSILISDEGCKVGFLLDYEADSLENPYEVETWGLIPTP